MIDGVNIKELKRFEDWRGIVVEGLRVDDPIFEKFGQFYVTTCIPGVAKAWHYHAKQSEYFCCVKGKMKLVLFDERENSPTKGKVQEIIMGFEKPKIVKIPPFVWHGFECADDEQVMAINVKTLPYDHENPDKVRIDFNDPKIPYTWNSKKGG